MARCDREDAERVKAMAAATDNVGLFFGEDIFFAIGSILLIQRFLSSYGIVLDPAAAVGLGDPDRDRAPS